MNFDIFTLLFCGAVTVTTGASLMLHINDQANHKKGLMLFAAFTMAWWNFSLSLVNYTKATKDTMAEESAP